VTEVKPLKRIVLVRHATAVETGPRGSDFHRRLKKRGRREAAIMADATAARVGTPDLMISSPADRAIETARAFADRCGYPQARIEQREELYGGLLPEEFLRIVNDVDDVYSVVMLFGHDPSFSEFASFLVPGFSDSIPKAGVVVIDATGKTWRSLRRGRGTLSAFERPPAIDDQKRMEEELRDEIARRIRTAVFAVLREIGVAENRDVVKDVARAATRIARTVRPFIGSWTTARPVAPPRPRPARRRRSPRRKP
jgi:phosphohistidine phosphatase